MNANSILVKLGGVGFMCRTGAYGFLNGGDHLEFSLPDGRTCRINLRHDVEVYSSRGELMMARAAVGDLPLFFNRNVLH